MSARTVKTTDTQVLTAQALLCAVMMFVDDCAATNCCLDDASAIEVAMTCRFAMRVFTMMREDLPPSCQTGYPAGPVKSLMPPLPLTVSTFSLAVGTASAQEDAPKARVSDPCLFWRRRLSRRRACSLQCSDEFGEVQKEE